MSTRAKIEEIVDLSAYPIDRPESAGWRELVAKCRQDLQRDGMFNLEGFLLPGVAQQTAAEISPLMASASFEHRRQHNIYFKPEIPGLPADHPALQLCETINHTLCADQVAGSAVMAIYDYPQFAEFLAATMQKDHLYTMDDPLACANVMAYRDGEALNWHFDRSEFTTTLLLQKPEQGGAFQYRSDLRTEDDPNYEGVASLLEGRDDQLRTLELEPGTLNVFRGKNTAHRVTPVKGGRERVIAVFSYYEKPGVTFSEAEKMGFYGRAA